MVTPAPLPARAGRSWGFVGAFSAPRTLALHEAPRATRTGGSLSCGGGSSDHPPWAPHPLPLTPQENTERPCHSRTRGRLFLSSQGQARRHPSSCPRATPCGFSVQGTGQAQNSGSRGLPHPLLLAAGHRGPRKGPQLPDPTFPPVSSTLCPNLYP